MAPIPHALPPLPTPDTSPLSTARAAGIFGKHLLALAFPLNALAFVLSGPHSAAIAPWFLLPIALAVVLDLRAAPERRQPSMALPAWPFDLLLAILVVLQVTNVVLLAKMFATQSLWSMDTLVGMVVVGSSSAYSGIVVAHELIHRPKNWVRQFGRLLLASVLYEHFYTEHVRGHHVRVGLREDPATARFGESFSHFYFRTVPAQFKSAYRLETTRLGDPEMSLFDRRVLHNRVVQGVIFEWGAAALLWIALGPAAFAMHLLQAWWATRGLEVVNYFEHWGIERDEKRVLPTHSWDTDSWFTYYALTGLSRHADHHAFASRPYQQLRVWEQSARLPRGYLAMFPLVLGNNSRCRKLMTKELQRRGLGPFRLGGNMHESSTFQSASTSGDAAGSVRQIHSEDVTA